jgi:hypothetical protein
MRSIRDIVVIAAVAIGLLLLVVYLFRPVKAVATPDTGDDSAPGDSPQPKHCHNVPENLPAFQNPVTPPGARAYLNVSDADWTPEYEARLRGFFLAVDVEPSDFTMKYFGADAIRQYLNTADGQLPDQLVLKGSKRCGTVVGVPSQDMPKPPFCLSFTSGNWLEPTYTDGKDVGSNAIREAFGISQAEWTSAMQSRVKGFFKAINIEPSAWNAMGLRQWYNRFPAKEYLASALGGLPDTLIALGCMRCDGKSDQFINDF